MKGISSILVAVDFSECSAAALRQAARIAAPVGAPVAAIHVVRPPIYVTEGFFVPVEFPTIDSLLEVAAQRWAGWPPARELQQDVRFDAVAGDPRTEILDRQKRDGFDLLIIGAHGSFQPRGGIGTTASACIQRAGCEVLVVRENQSQPFRSIAACIDFSPTSMNVLENAVRAAAMDSAALHILHVYDDPWHGLGPPDAVRANMPDLAQQYQSAVVKRMQAFCQPLAHELGALKANYHALQADNHGRGIDDFIVAQGCDLVVLGTRAKWNVRDFVLGSTAERVLRGVRCAALAVRPTAG